ncbi:MAG: FAD-binding protein [Bacteroidetes bacterium RBG_19FT_COMBO_42_10]|nr:MAG: FAD-binding protein [Bacteroidetes bacterium RBG_19FT_COMBO_42_10]
MDLSGLQKELKGDLFTDDLQRILYATDASSYRELPLAVTRPKDKDDIQKIISFASSVRSSVIPRGGGTSLAGQVVGSGIVVDVSRYMNHILEFNREERWVIVEPGVILAELNKFLLPHGLQFGPETSTADRCCMAGMLGNNSCGLHSIIYGSVRDHILETDVILSDGSEVTFRELTTEEFLGKCNGDPASHETSIYRNIRDTLSDPENRTEIMEQFPHPDLKRRNNGYALDSLMDTDPFCGNGKKINICKLLAGSEGTLAFTTRMKLTLIPVPSGKTGLICAHFTRLQDALKANILILRHNPASIEMIDDFILNCTKENIEQKKNRFFIKGEPAIVLLIELMRDSVREIEDAAGNIESELTQAGYGYHFPLFTNIDEIQKVWALRKAGLGVLLNIPGEKRSVQVIEDTSVLPEFLPEYIVDFEKVLKKFNLSCAYYAHVATGELHLSPLLNLKDPADVVLYRNLAEEIASLVKKYRGSLSGEHGDGRLRGEFIPFMLGQHNYRLLKELKRTWDPENIFNPGKIIDTPPMDQNLRYRIGEQPAPLTTTFSFSEEGTLLFAVEKCSGSGDCRKSSIIGGTMCPTFMVTGDEDKSTRGRANILREFLTRSVQKYPWDHEEIYQVMDLCLSCKACKSECPSNVDMTRFKAEFLQHYYEIHGVPFRTWLIGWLPRINSLGMVFRPVTNFITGLGIFKKMIGFEEKRRIPSLSKTTLKAWGRRHRDNQTEKKTRVYLFADEFTNYNESDLGIKTILLLEKLGYQVAIPKHRESGRTFLSRGMLRSAKKIANKNVLLLKEIITEESPLLGLEPSAILTFRDEYPEIVNPRLRDDAGRLGERAILLEEFICREFDNGKITSGQFTSEKLSIKLHGHCQQKAISSTGFTKKMLSIPVNYMVDEIPGGCCGMAGAFGYEKEHYELSMKIGEMVLFPAVRSASEDTIIAAPGTSCRHHISEGTGRTALHPAEILYEALIKD